VCAARLACLTGFVVTGTLKGPPACCPTGRGVAFLMVLRTRRRPKPTVCALLPVCGFDAEMAAAVYLRAVISLVVAGIASRRLIMVRCACLVEHVSEESLASARLRSACGSAARSTNAQEHPSAWLAALVQAVFYTRLVLESQKPTILGILLATVWVHAGAFSLA
jgi:hypothetical protein